MTINRGIYLLGIIGFISGYILANQAIITWAWPWIFITLSCFLYALSYDDKQLIRLAGTTLTVAFVISTPFLFVNLNENYFSFRNMLFIGAYPAIVYIAHCFHFACHRESRIRTSYANLFAAVWNTIALLLSALIFCLLGAFLIALSVYAFYSAGFELPYRLYYSSHFLFISNFTLFFIGLGVAHQNINIIYNMRFLLLRMMYYLFPFLALISSIYCVLYAMRSITLWNAQEPGMTISFLAVGSLIALITFTASGILFFNATFQDGDTPSRYSSSIATLLKGYRVVLCLLSIMMFRAIFQSVPGVENANLIIISLTPVLFCLAYAVAAFMPVSQERKLIIYANVTLSLLFVLVMLIVNNPFTFGHYMSEEKWKLIQF